MVKRTYFLFLALAFCCKARTNIGTATLAGVTPQTSDFCHGQTEPRSDIRNDKTVAIQLQDALNYQFKRVPDERMAIGEFEGKQFELKEPLKRQFVVQTQFVTDGAFSPVREVYKVPVILNNRSQGYDSIWPLVQSAQLEHGWVYIPSIEAWVDITLYSRGQSVGWDVFLVSALHEFFNEIEIYHSHPPATLVRSYRDRPDITLDRSLAGSLPSGGDLGNLVGSAWRMRHLPHQHGIFGPHGLTMIAATKTLMAADGGSQSDIGYQPTLYVAKEGETAVETIKRLATVQEQANYLKLATPPGPSFSIRFFAPGECQEIGPWIEKSRASLSAEEIKKRLRPSM
ncbi:MAG: hypothetical protein NTV34_14645 [Proteobacteria bacterium]|nr:hypothetical protein [Pseudomonadota bacterium]